MLQNKILILKSHNSKSDSEIHNYLTEKNLNVETATFKDINISLSPDKFELTIKQIPINSFSTVIFRVPFSKDLNHKINSLILYCQKEKINLINNIIDNPQSLSKLVQHVYFFYNGLPFPATVSYSDELTNQKILDEFGTNFILKKSLSSKGDENYLIRDFDTFRKLKENTNLDSYIIQKYIPNDFDYRITVIGGKAISIIKRSRIDKENEHRNNTSKGAYSEIINFDGLENLSELAVKACSVLNMDIAGIDIVVDKFTGKPYILEANSSISLLKSNKEENLNALKELIKTSFA